jgi:hypothetical protein
MSKLALLQVTTQTASRILGVTAISVCLESRFSWTSGQR